MFVFCFAYSCRMELMKSVMVQQEGVITQLRKAEQSVRHDCQVLPLSVSTACCFVCLAPQARVYASSACTVNLKYS
jgi:hypothetical protein